ncbi:hypothetical protein ACFYY1_39875 [Streptomyces sp. NPDC001890]|uniref:hypothetical protein n=1 Tax=Streptomyces sp. NPDC001890 TaxID=3364620 RepID=UPI0036A7CD7F
MGVFTSAPDEGVAVVTVGFSPVNASPVQGWYDFAAAERAAGADPRVRCVTVAAGELHRHGSVRRVVPRERLLDTALEPAREISAKDGQLVRFAEAAMNGIDPVDVRHSYGFEQGFTFEADLSGVADRVRDTFGEDVAAGEDVAFDTDKEQQS